MELINATQMRAGHTLCIDKSGREVLLVVMKGTFELPKAGEPLALHAEQMPLVMADTFTGEPGFSAPVHEVDFAPSKRYCDVILLGSAYAPQGRPTPRTQVELRVDSLVKTCQAVGHRHWRSGLTGISASEPEPFVKMPISYDRAFGGSFNASDDPADHDSFLPNPVGLGFYGKAKANWIDGKPLPNTEMPGERLTAPNKRCRPMAFGPIGRNWEPRCRFAGTYDQKWVDKVYPFLPQDFDERYFQCAPADQQIPLPIGSVQISLLNLTPDGLRQFTIPRFEAPVHVFPKNGAREDAMAALDTIVLEPDEERLTMTWRYSRPLRRNLFEIGQVVVGKPSKAWWRATTSGKKHHASLADAVASKRAARESD